MELHIGRDVLKPMYREKHDTWYISRNGREAIYNNKNELVEFATEVEAHEFLAELHLQYTESTLIPHIDDVPKQLNLLDTKGGDE